VSSTTHLYGLINNCNADCSEDYYAVAEEEESDECTTFLIFGILMGCLLIVASVMMCLLAHRLNRVVSSYKVVNHTIHRTVMPGCYRERKLTQSYKATAKGME
jgi:hypothetical protein